MKEDVWLKSPNYFTDKPWLTTQQLAPINLAYLTYSQRIKTNCHFRTGHSQLIVRQRIMLLKSLTLLLVIGTSLALMPPQAELKAEQGLMDFLMKSRAVTKNGDFTDYCFGRYLPILKSVSDQYETDYKRCADDYEWECSAIDGKYVLPRENITYTAWESCQLLHNCTFIANTVEVFECFAGRVRENWLSCLHQIFLIPCFLSGI